MTDLVVISLEAWDEVWRRNQHLIAGVLRHDPALRVLFVEPPADPTHDIRSRRHPRFARGRREVAIDLRGEAVGVKEGGIVEQMLHEVQIECPVSSIPDKLHVNVSALKIGDALTVGELPLPEGVKMLSHGEVVVVHCVEPTEEEELALPTEGAKRC